MVAAAEGRIAGAAAACHANGGGFDEHELVLANARALQRRHERFQAAVRRTLTLPAKLWSITADDTIVCRCEGISRGRLERARAAGHLTLDAIKRNTRAGMGWCGGRTCLQAVAAICADGEPAPTTEPMRARPIARPTTMGALAAFDEGDPT